MDPSGTFAQIDAALNQLTTNLGLLLPLCKADGVADLSQRAIALADVTCEILTMCDQIRDAAPVTSALLPASRPLMPHRQFL